jgi:hypothetical protein
MRRKKDGKRELYLDKDKGAENARLIELPLMERGFPRISFKDNVESKPPGMSYIWPGFLSGSVGALIAPGGTGKSMWALEAAVSIASGVDFLDIKASSGSVVYLSAEDPEIAVRNRIYDIGNSSVASGIDVRETDKNLRIYQLMGESKNLEDNLFRSHVISLCLGASLVVFDTLSRMHEADENSNSDMARVLSRLEEIAKATGASALYLHHASKLSVREGQADLSQAARGASSLIDNARWCGYLAKMSEKEAGSLIDKNGPVDGRRDLFVRFGSSKENYGNPMGDKWFIRLKEGVLAPVSLKLKDRDKKHAREKV